MFSKNGSRQTAQLEAAIDMIKRSQEQLPVGPALISWVRIVLLPLCIWCGWSGNYTGMFWLTLAASASDYFDGWFARRWRQSSTPGKTLDMLADKLFLSVMLIFLARQGAVNTTLALIPAWYHIAVVLGLLMVSWSISIPVVAITTSERLTIILSYILVITSTGVLAYPGKSIFQSLSTITQVFTSIAVILGTISYFRFARRLIQRYVK